MTTTLDHTGATTPGPPPPARTPRSGLLAPRTWVEFLYTLIDLGPAIAFFVLIVTLLSVGVGLVIIYVGVPILALGLLVARFVGLTQRAMALALLDLPTSSPEPITAARPGPIGAMRAVLTDALCWRAVGYFMIKIVLAPVTFGLSLGFYAAGVGAITYPVRRPYLPEQVAADGTLHRGTRWRPDYLVDSWPRIILLAVLGLGAVARAPGWCNS